MAQPLYVAFVWHMHQPSYRDTRTGEYRLPWVRLHAAKDYLHVAEILADFPEIHQTINIVPSLGEQILDYAAGQAVDRALALCQKPSLTLDDKREILDTFFSINWDHFLFPVPRYSQLARLRDLVGQEAGLLSDAYYTDLMVWFNLAWIDPSLRQRNRRIQLLVEKGKNFSRADLDTVLAFHREVCARVLPAYRKLADAGHVELSTSPYYHPILPLLIDLQSARDASPDLSLPRLPFSHPEDAVDHLMAAVEFHQNHFGQTPKGLWPSEGAVSEAAIELVAKFSPIHWVASDEHLLERVFDTHFARDVSGQLEDPRPLCQPYRLKGQGPALFFRDQILSDRIGFVYQHMDSLAASEDLIQRLLNVADKLVSDSSPYVISIVLDGENCWEFYPNNGDDFLRSLFEKLRREPRLQTITPSEYLDRFAVTGQIDRLPAGSWINANLETWIGEPSQNRAWELLALTRSALTAWERQVVEKEPERRQRAWDALRVAEGSDWFWWYYRRNRTKGSEIFDCLYRQHLSNVYQAIGAPAPDWLAQPIHGQATSPRREVAGPMRQTPLSGEHEASTVWVNAGYLEPEASTGAMQVGASLFRRFYFGYDADHLYVRLETLKDSRALDLTVYLQAPTEGVAHPVSRTDGTDRLDDADLSFNWRIDFPAESQGPARISIARDAGRWEPIAATVEHVRGELALEARIATNIFGIRPNDQIHLLAAAERAGQIIEILPSRGVATLVLGDVDVSLRAKAIGGDGHA